MKSKFIIGSLAFLSVGAIAWAAKDPVVMTINGEDVPKSEFEYLYNKNSQQQIEAQPLDEYVGMFELYKMKVADAKAEGIDTTASFLREMEQYRRELANPYLADSLYLNSLIDEAYRNSLEEVDYYHIMFPKGRNAKENAASIEKADSVRKALLAGADFAELAKQYSSDKTASFNGGHLGYIAAGRLPYTYEHVAYSLEPGEISEVVESNVGYHILKVGPRRPAHGAVKAAHIMKMVRQGASADDEARAKVQIDSLYQLVIANPDSFEAVARSNSDDQASARMGGNLGWFDAGQMVPEFSEVAFNLAVDEISEPVRSPFGWHIIKKQGEQGVKSREEIKPELLSQFNDPRDDRYRLIKQNRDKNLAAKHNGSVNEEELQKLKNYVSSFGLDKNFRSSFNGNTSPLYTIKGKTVTVADFINDNFDDSVVSDTFIAGLVFAEKFSTAHDNALVEAEEDWLYANNADYRNLLNEYRDGSLLYEVSLQKVWDKAANDTPGLEKYFAAHRDEYKFKEPRAKGYLVLAKNDSIADLIKARYGELGKDTVVQTLRQEFRQEATIDRLLAPQGLNRFVDKVMFDGPDPELNPKYPVYFILDARVIAEPEEMNDVKGAVTADYQQLLEQNWTTELRKKYPVKRNEGELRKMRKVEPKVHKF